MTEIVVADEGAASIINGLAEPIWQDTYGSILAPEQLRFMLDHIYNPDRLRQQIKNRDQTYLLLLEDKNPVGFASYSARSENPLVYKLHKLYCLKSTRGKGFGTLLLSHIEKTVKSKGINTLELNVNRYNPAKGFYEKQGYEVIYEEDIPIGPYWMNDYVMRKLL